MSEPLAWLIVLVVSYLLGAVPFGYLVVRIANGRDIRAVESGRTGGTNAMRAAGCAAGLATAVLDVLKAAAGVWLARWLLPGQVWAEIAAPLMAIMGHNYSIYMLERGDDNKVRLRGGAGGAPCVGGTFGLWPPALLFLLPVAGLIWYFVGYASVTTMSVAVISSVIFAVRAYLGLGPWEYAAYGLISLVLIVWSLRPNIKRLMDGTERLHGWRARRQKQADPQPPAAQ